ncbi:hypothetical protein [Peribacillus deserti]|uniref:Uncharacterized protein n=1 Tax=Peribacillus deserti TaxID=673318 RepID=A0A2N5M558_9BACI|nr:hypothetical protein [Peribacillus deserti]PLT29490.1 hypothetical protein CUU66_12940 [Peribacillus deserti]
MSEHEQYLAEKEKIDQLLSEGYNIYHAVENLDGAFVEFFHLKSGTKKTLHIRTANARKYFSSIFIQQKSS